MKRMIMWGLLLALTTGFSATVMADEDTPYQKLFKDKKVETAQSFLTARFTDKGDLYFELPKSMLGKDMLMTSSVEKTSDGGTAAVGFTAPKSLHVMFMATDSLVLLTEVSSFRYQADNDTKAEALRKSHSGAVIAAFPIRAYTPDSCYVFDAAPYFREQDARLDPVDPTAADSFDGLVSKELRLERERSMLYGVKGYEDNVSVFALESYAVSTSVLGMSGGDEIMTVLTRRTLSLLPEEPMQGRIADPRIGVRPVKYTRFSASDRGSKPVRYATRWRPGRQVVFYIDTLFPAPVAEAITKGVLKWNEAFAEIGSKDRISVLPYPDSDPKFDPNDFRYSCIKYEANQTEKIRSQFWTDPRSGEILSATIYVPMGIMRNYRQRMFAQLAGVAPEVRDADGLYPLIYEGIESDVIRHTGLCLGLDFNYFGSSTVPVDSLRSPSFTSRYGLSGSAMDVLPYNFVARPGDKERGVRLVHTQIGPYDRFIIRWLYGTVDGAKTPEEEVPFLNTLVEKASDNPLCGYRRNQPNLRLDPRTTYDDLGDDAVKSTKLHFENLKDIISNIDKWLEGQDKDYRFRLGINAMMFQDMLYPMLDLLNYVGGIYLSEHVDGDGKAPWEAIPEEKQREALLYVLEQMDDLDWANNRTAYHDIFFVRDLAAFVQTNAIDRIFTSISRARFAENYSDNPYSMEEVYDDLFDYITSKVRSGKKGNYDLLLQYMLVGYTQRASNAAGVASSRRLADNGKDGFEPVRSLDFQGSPVDDHLLYARLLKVKKVYDRAARSVSDEEQRAHYRYISTALERFLKLD